MNKPMGPILKTDIAEDGSIKKLMEFEMTRIFPADGKQKDPAHTKRQTETARHITGPTIVLQIYSAYLFDSSVPLPEEPDTE